MEVKLQFKGERYQDEAAIKVIHIFYMIAYQYFLKFVYSLKTKAGGLVMCGFWFGFSKHFNGGSFISFMMWGDGAFRSCLLK